MIDKQRLASLLQLVPNAVPKDDAGREYVWLPELQVQLGEDVRTMDALLCLTAEGSYYTRLFLAQSIPERPTVHGAGWIQRMIFGRNWHTWSWKDVRAEQPLIVILREHLGALK